MDSKKISDCHFNALRSNVFNSLHLHTNAEEEPDAKTLVCKLVAQAVRDQLLESLLFDGPLRGPWH